MKTLLRSLATFTFFFFLQSAVTAQVGINTDDSDPDSSAMLDIKSTDKGMLIPRMTSDQREAISTPANGLLVYDTDNYSFYYYDGSEWLSLSAQNPVFEYAAATDVVRLNDESTADFVFGSAGLGDSGFSEGDQRFFFDKSKAAFRAGDVNVDQWDDGNVGDFSVAFGKNTIASGKGAFGVGRNSIAAGDYSFALGDAAQANQNFSVAIGNTAVSSGLSALAVGTFASATGMNATALGTNANATQPGAIAFGFGTNAQATGAVALGYQTSADSVGAVAFGFNTNSSGLGAVAVGYENTAHSAFETTLGAFSTNYIPNSATSFDANDRLFTIGNGPNNSSRSDAFMVLKNGHTFINGALTIDSSYTFPATDGTNGQTLITDGSGNLSWTSLSGSGDQALSLNNNTLSLTNGGSVDLSSYLDNTDNQDLSLSGNTLSLTNDGTTVDLSSYLDNTDAQALSLSGDTLSLTNGGSVFLSTLSFDELSDQDNDTKIQVEESADEDIIRFDIEGSEAWRMEDSRLVSNHFGKGIFIGQNAGASDTLSTVDTYTYNTFIGHEAGRDNTGPGNVAVGAFAFRKNVDGFGNLAIGKDAFSEGQGNKNVAVGTNVIRNAVAVESNTGVGYDALKLLRNGNYNVALGDQAGNGNIPHDKTGSTYLGYRAGIYNMGDYNVFIGHKAASNTSWQNVSNRLVIANDAGGPSDVLVYGEFDNELLRINGTLNINNAFSFPIADGTSGQVLATDGHGTLNWTTLNDNQTLSLNTNTLSLTNGGSVDLSSYLDNTDNQDLSLSGNTLSLTNDGTTVDLSSYLDNTDAQALSLNNNTLSLTNGGSVNLGSYSDNIYNTNGNINGERTLTFTGSEQFLTIQRNDNDNQQGISFRNEGTFYTSLMVTPADGAGNDGGLDFRTKNSDLLKANIGNTMRLTDAGTVTLPEYGQGNITGTLTKMLAVTNTGEVIETNSLGDHTATERLNLNTQNILLYDGQDNGAILGIVTDDPTYNTKGVLIRTADPSNGDEVLSVAGGNGVVFQVKDNGQLKIEDGTQGDGKVLTSDADGNTNWEEPADRIVFAFDQDPQTLSGNGWNTASDLTSPLNVTAGDVITVRIAFSAEMGSGSGTDNLQFRVRGDGANGCVNNFGGETDLLETYDDHRGEAIQTFVQHTFQANCSGTYTFGLQTGLDNSDDEVVVDNVQVTAVKY